MSDVKLQAEELGVVGIKPIERGRLKQRNISLEDRQPSNLREKHILTLGGPHDISPS